MLNEQNINRVRGDTAPLYLSVIDDGNGLSGELSGSLPSVGSDAYDVTGCAVVLTVNAKRSPSSTDTPQLQVVGTLLSPAANGQVQLDLTADQADLVARYWYDVQLTDAIGAVHTVARGRWVSDQDITKGNPGQTWTPDDSIADGTPHPFDRSMFWVVSSDANNFTLTYETNDGRKVLRAAGQDSGYVRFSLSSCGELATESQIGPTGVYRYDLLIFAFELPRIVVGSDEIECAPASACATLVISPPETLVDVEVESANAIVERSSLESSFTGSYVWMRIAMEFDFDAKTIKAKIWEDGSGEPPGWDVETPGSTTATLGYQRIVIVPTVTLQSYIDIAEFSWERLS